jgi:hypothetical protein
MSVFIQLNYFKQTKHKSVEIGNLQSPQGEIIFYCYIPLEIKIHYCQIAIRSGTVCCKGTVLSHGNEPLSSIKDGEFLDSLSNC